MDYAKAAINTGYQAGIAQNQALNSVPRTITSAISRVDGLNERLSEVIKGLTSLSDQIGGPRPIAGASAGEPKVQSPAVVDRLNDSAEYAHVQLSTIDSLLASIARSLG